jgi:hypothetical protein
MGDRMTSDLTFEGPEGQKLCFSFFVELIELNWIELNGMELNGMEWNGMEWNGMELNWIELNWIELNWIVHINLSHV